jgi:hypothetical protein
MMEGDDALGGAYRPGRPLARAADAPVGVVQWEVRGGLVLR